MNSNNKPKLLDLFCCAGGGDFRTPCRATVEIGRWNIPIETQKEAIGIFHINDLRKLSESIPPKYTEYIGKYFIDNFYKTIYELD